MSGRIAIWGFGEGDIARRPTSDEGIHGAAVVEDGRGVDQDAHLWSASGASSGGGANTTSGMTLFVRTQLEAALAALGALLTARGLHYEVVLIGGGNLILRGLVTRPTLRGLGLEDADVSLG